MAYKYIVWLTVEGEREWGVTVDDPETWTGDALGFEVVQYPWDEEKDEVDFSRDRIVGRGRASETLSILHR